MEHEDLLGGDLGPVASRDNLEGVLRRHLRRRRRFTGGVAAVVLAVGAGGGVAIGELVASTGGQIAALTPRTSQNVTTGGTGTTLLPEATPSNGVPLPASANGTASAAPPGLSWSRSAETFGPLVPGTSSSTGGDQTSSPQPDCLACGDTYYGATTAQRLFERTANGIDVRVYELHYGFPAVAQGSTVLPRYPICEPSTALLVEVSDGGAVAEVTIPSASSTPRPIDLVTDQVEGVLEGTPMAVLVVRTGTGVSGVGARFGNGAGDEMSVVDGVAVLAAPMPAGAAAADAAARANVVAYSASGRQLQSFSVPQAPSFAEPTQCLIVPPVRSGPPTGSGSSVGGSPGSAGSSTGSVGPASTTAP